MTEQTLYKSINAQCCCFNLRKVTRSITQYFDRKLESAGIRVTQFTLLIELANVHAKTLTEMAEGLVMDRTTLTRNLRPLETLGFITHVKVADKRAKAYALTHKGQEALRHALPLWEQAQKVILHEFGHDRYVKLLVELGALKATALLPKADKRKKHKASTE